MNNIEIIKYPNIFDNSNPLSFTRLVLPAIVKADCPSCSQEVETNLWNDQTMYISPSFEVDKEVLFFCPNTDCWGHDGVSEDGVFKREINIEINIEETKDE